MDLLIDIDSLVSELETLAQFSSLNPPAVTRVVFTEDDIRARSFVKSLCLAAGLVIREDAVGNTFARWVGDEPALPPIGTGSHIDAIPNAGMYDGTVGVLGGLEAIRALQRSGFRPRRSIELILFTSEEPTRFGIGCLGSRMLSGTIRVDKAESLIDAGGLSLDEARTQTGFTGLLSSVILASGTYAAFIELHIEQGPTLEKEGISIGVVHAIAAPASGEFTILGEGGHAGAVLMHDRRDALVAAAEVITETELIALNEGGPDTVATIGICDVFPSAVNSIPSRVKLSLDVRDIDLDRRDKVLGSIVRFAASRIPRREVEVQYKLLNADAPCHSDPVVVAAIEKACSESHISSKRMISRAYHDTLFMSHIGPVAMIFIPCRGGVSHRPDEYSSPKVIERGVLVLAKTLADLAK